jgi:hypothetical protein
MPLIESRIAPRKRGSGCRNALRVLNAMSRFVSMADVTAERDDCARQADELARDTMSAAAEHAAGANGAPHRVFTGFPGSSNPRETRPARRRPSARTRREVRHDEAGTCPGDRARERSRYESESQELTAAPRVMPHGGRGQTLTRFGRSTGDAQPRGDAVDRKANRIAQARVRLRLRAVRSQHADLQQRDRIDVGIAQRDAPRKDHVVG